MKYKGQPTTSCDSSSPVGCSSCKRLGYFYQWYLSFFNSWSQGDHEAPLLSISYVAHLQLLKYRHIQSFFSVFFSTAAPCSGSLHHLRYVNHARCWSPRSLVYFYSGTFHLRLDLHQRVAYNSNRALLTGLLNANFILRQISNPCQLRSLGSYHKFRLIMESSNTLQL